MCFGVEAAKNNKGAPKTHSSFEYLSQKIASCLHVASKAIEAEDQKRLYKGVFANFDEASNAARGRHSQT